MIFKILVICLFALQVIEISGHGRLMKPISRTSAWRKYPSLFPANFGDHQMFCGGIHMQHERNGGKCGICGEAANLQKRFERGGSMYRDLIVREYLKGQTIEVEVEITANHWGYFQFKVCNIDGNKSDATQECLDKNILSDISGKTKFFVDRNSKGIVKFEVDLPADLLCNHCVFQWKYNTGNSWGVDPITKRGGIGLGNQEQFYGCSDIQISLTKRGNSLADRPDQFDNQPIFINNDNKNIKENVIINDEEEMKDDNIEVDGCSAHETVYDDVIEYLEKSLLELNKLKESLKKPVQTESKSENGYAYAINEINEDHVHSSEDVDAPVDFPSQIEKKNDNPKSKVKKIEYPKFIINIEKL